MPCPRWSEGEETLPCFGSARVEGRGGVRAVDARRPYGEAPPQSPRMRGETPGGAEGAGRGPALREADRALVCAQADARTRRDLYPARLAMSVRGGRRPRTCTICASRSAAEKPAFAKSAILRASAPGKSSSKNPPALSGIPRPSVASSSSRRRRSRMTETGPAGLFGRTSTHIMHERFGATFGHNRARNARAKAVLPPPPVSPVVSASKGEGGRGGEAT